MRRLSTLLGVVLAALAVGVGQAAAEESVGAAQAAGQSATSGQGAGAGGGAYQSGPTNTAMDIRVLSPGDNGSVTQSNTTTAGAVAKNTNETDQTVGQSQTGGGYGSDYSQIAGQSAANRQSADADATAVQLAPSNESTSIRVLSPGNNGNVNQSNDATAGAIAANDNDTTQSTGQSQTGGSGNDYTQIAGQDAANRQTADADATAVQVKPSNEATSIRVLSPGDDGNVSQSNDATAIGAAVNDNETKQSVNQSQGVAAPVATDAKAKDKDRYDGGSDYTQIAGQSASNAQHADADAVAVQVKPSNESTSIRVLSPGDDGDVKQSNSTTAVAVAANDNDTTQTIAQAQTGGGYGSDYLQIAGQGSWSTQDAAAAAVAVQLGASNTNAPVRVGSPGDDGDVSQSNSTTAIGLALNDNDTTQSIRQNQSGREPGSDYLQVAGQGSWNTQRAGALAVAVQLGASNDNAPVRVGSRGGGGSVKQSNAVGALAAALNGNATHESLSQAQTGYGSEYLQIAGQGSWSDQRGGAMSLALQGMLEKKRLRR